MSYKNILPLLVVLGSMGFGQNATTPSNNVVSNQAGSAPAAAASAPENPAGRDGAKKTQLAAPQKKLEKVSGDSSFADVATASPTHAVVPATALSNDQLLAQAKTVYVVSHSFFVKKEQLERGLLERKELSDCGFHVVQDPKTADLILSVRRAPFQNNFPFTFTERVSGIVVMGGTVNSLFGTVPGKIAGRLADKLKEVYKQAASH
jgi:hypothetical protein